MKADYGKPGSMREEVINFLSCETSYSRSELATWTDKELDDYMGRAFPVEY